MKIAELILLYKGKEINRVVNYRIISLLLTTSKILEKIVYTRLINFINKHELLYDSQDSFHSKTSCEHAMFKLVGNLLQAMNQNLDSVAIFLDLLKAFDTLNHEVLI